MKKIIFVIFFFTGCTLLISCKKEKITDATVNPPSISNKPPVAVAGPDQIITLPLNSGTLNGTASVDPDGAITSYSWTKISGPASFNILNPDSARTTINQLVLGRYQFELTVKDNGGLYAKDTIEITVLSLALCNNQLTPFGNLSIARKSITTATAGTKILFAGGVLIDGSFTSRVDIYDMISNTWSTAELSIVHGEGMAVAVAGSKVFFAGGLNRNITNQVSTRVDIYDASANTWSTAELSVGRWVIGAASAGNKVVFAGGFDFQHDPVDVVDIYDISTNTWSTNHLSEEKVVSATSLNNKIYFAGSNNLGGTNKVEIYNASSNSWSIITRLEPTEFIATIAAGNTIYWAGGLINYTTRSDKVEMYDVSTGISTYHQLSAARDNFQAVIKNNRILFYTGYPFSNNVDIYDINTKTWSACSISQAVRDQAIISAAGKVYAAGGISAAGVLSNQVWQLDF